MECKKLFFIGGKNPNDSDPVSYGNSDDLLRLIKSRRSVRFYKNQDIPSDKIAKFIYRGASSMVVVSVDKSKAIAGCENADPIIALSYLDLYAQSPGLGTVWCDAALTIAQEMPEVRALLEIPEGYTLNYIMLLGVPNVKYKRTVQREPAYVKII